MRTQSKDSRNDRVMFWLLATASGLLIALFIRDYSMNDALPIGRLPLLLVSLGFLAYYGKKTLAGHSNRE